MRTVSSSGQQLPIVAQGRVENVTAGAASASTLTGISRNVQGVLITPDEDCWMLVGREGVTVSATTGTVLRASGVYFWAVDPDDYIAFLQKTTPGNVNITELAS